MSLASLAHEGDYSVTTSTKGKLPASPEKSAAAREPNEGRTSRVTSLRLDSAERHGGGIGRRVWGLLKTVVILAIVCGVGYGAYVLYFDEQPDLSVDSVREKAGEIWNSTFSQTESAPKARTVEAYRIPDPASQNVFLSLAGFVRPETEVRVGPRVPGNIIKVPVELGDRVKKGDVLAEIEATTYLADLDQAKAELALAEANLLELQNGALPEEIEEARAMLNEAEAARDLSIKERERHVRLKEARNVISDSKFDAVDAEYKRAEAQVNSLKQKLKRIEQGTRAEQIAAAKARLDVASAAVARAKYYADNVAIVAPIDGTILEKRTAAGEIVRPDVLLSDMFVMADLNRLHAEVDVQERDLHRIRIGNACRIYPDAYPDRIYVGTISRILPQINRQRAVATVKVAVTKPDDYLLPNMNCRVEFLSETSASEDTTIRIPSNAAVFDGGNTIVYKLDGTKARRCEVTVSKAGDAWVEIGEGLKHGDVVLLPTGGALQDGQEVTTQFASTATPKASQPQ